MRRFLSLLSSVLLHSLLLALVCSPAVVETTAVPLYDLRIETADHVIVLEEAEAPPIEDEMCLEDPVIRDAKVGDQFVTKTPLGAIGLAGSQRFDPDPCFEGPTTNGVIGIGGGAGGAFGGRRGGRRNLRAGGGGRMAPGAILPKAPQLLARLGDVGETRAFPLRHIAVDAEVSGWIASTELRQTYENPFDVPVEAVYVMPLPTGIAINGFVMDVADRRIVGIVKPREEARKIYEDARARGQTASLMSQERPNVFEQSVANIAPKESVDVTITYFHAVAYSGGAFEYVFPMVVAPRYDPGGGPDGNIGAGTVVGDRSATPAPTTDFPTKVLPAGFRSGRDVDIAVSVDAGMRIQDVQCPTHEADIRPDGADRVHVTLTPKEAIPDRDFVLRWFVADEETTAGVVAHCSRETGGFFSVLLVPKLDPGEADLSAREVTFVIDSSGSMNGVPIDTCKRLVEKTLRGMRPFDRFNVIQFAGGSGTMADAPIEATPENVERGVKYVNALSGGGGTEMLAGIRAWLAQPRDPRYVRMVVFLTDGLVRNEEGILATIRDEGQDARWHAFGIGSSVNRYLIEGIGKHGRGSVEVVLPQEFGSAEAAADRLRQRFDSALLTDVTLDTNGLPITDVFPARLPDLYAGQPIVALGRFSAPAEGDVFFRGRIGNREVAIPCAVVLPEDAPEHAALGALWARTRIEDVEDELLGTRSDTHVALEREIEDLGMDFGLVTRRTSYVAVDEARTVGDGRPVHILQPHELPLGVRYWGHVGAPPGMRTASVPSWGLTVASSEDGEMMVVGVEPRSQAARAGLMRSFVVETVDGVRVRDVRHLNAVLAEVEQDRVELGYRNGAGGEVRTVEVDRP